MSEKVNTFVDNYWKNYMSKQAFQANMDIITILKDDQLTLDEKCILIYRIGELFTSSFKDLLLEVRKYE